MAHADKSKKAEAELVRLLVEGEARLEKYRGMGARARLAGVILCTLAIVIAMFPPTGVGIVAAILGLAGGICVGAFLIYDSSLTSWPIVRPLLDAQAVQRLIEAHKEKGANQEPWLKT